MEEHRLATAPDKRKLGAGNRVLLSYATKDVDKTACAKGGVPGCLQDVYPGQSECEKWRPVRNSA